MGEPPLGRPVVDVVAPVLPVDDELLRPDLGSHEIVVDGEQPVGVARGEVLEVLGYLRGEGDAGDDAIAVALDAPLAVLVLNAAGGIRRGPPLFLGRRVLEQGRRERCPGHHRCLDVGPDIGPGGVEELWIVGGQGGDDAPYLHAPCVSVGGGGLRQPGGRVESVQHRHGSDLHNGPVGSHLPRCGRDVGRGQQQLVLEDGHVPHAGAPGFGEPDVVVVALLCT
jgi:hypothetical protein